MGEQSKACLDILQAYETESCEESKASEVIINQEDNEWLKTNYCAYSEHEHDNETAGVGSTFSEDDGFNQYLRHHLTIHNKFTRDLYIKVEACEKTVRDETLINSLLDEITNLRKECKTKNDKIKALMS